MPLHTPARSSSYSLPEGAILNLASAASASPLPATIAPQAGDYDEVAVKAKLEAQISDAPAIMYSFTT